MRAFYLCRMLICWWCINCVVTAAERYAEIRVLDSETQRGLPLAELTTVNGETLVTDNAGRIAVNQPDLLNRTVYFHVRSHGYRLAADGFGYTGIKLQLTPGRQSTIRLQRRQPAERLCRLTGAGRFRDSELLGYELTESQRATLGNVVGQDSIQAVLFRDQIHWFWGDTLRADYPLGLFRTSGATSSIAALSGDRWRDGIDYRYFTDNTGFARAMIPLPERGEGVVWIDGVCVVEDQLLAHYSRRRALDKQLDHGLAKYDAVQGRFEPWIDLPATETWRFPYGHPILVRDHDRAWLQWGLNAAVVRAPATLAAIKDATQYEAWTYAQRDTSGKLSPSLDTNGVPRGRWQRDLPPLDSASEAEWVNRGLLNAAETYLYPVDAADERTRIVLHHGTVRWNDYRRRWVLIVGQSGGKASFLGEIWYAEAHQPNGPFRRAAHIVTHDRQSFYNVCQHSFLDRDQGRKIAFEGTYTHTFSGNNVRTPRYDYNQILYQLDLDNSVIRGARAE